jgi:polynucleotide 5'-hydroxyl-kinase GRC3/NOL9
LTVPAEWEALLSRLEAGTILLLGEAGTGKTSLAQYLLFQLDRAFKRVALVDTDVGQTHIGVPACMGLGLTAPWRAPEALWFVGDVTPKGLLLPTVVGAARLVRQAREARAQVILVDTTGMVSDSVGRVLKTHKAEATRADQVVALQKNDELEPLLTLLAGDGRVIHRLHPSSQAHPGSPSRRREYREARLRAHFRGAQSRPIAGRKVVNRQWEPGTLQDMRSGTVVGLLADSGLCLGLGLVETVHRDHLEVLTPCRRLDEVARVQEGVLRLPLDLVERA